MTTHTDQTKSDAVMDAWVEEQNSRIGEITPVPKVRTHHREYTLAFRHVTEDMIRFFALVNGDTNPLWRDAEYANASPWGGIVAPPLFIYTVAATTVLPEAPAIDGMTMYFAGSATRMTRPLRPGDVIDAVDVWHGIREHSKPGRPHRMFIMTGERRFSNQNGDVVNSIESRVALTIPRSAQADEPPAARPARKRRRFSDAELNEIYAHYDAELQGALRRGAAPRFWEDVREGDEIGLTICGPVDSMDVACFVGLTGSGVGNADKWALIRQEKHISPLDPETGAYHFQMAWHLNDAVAQAAGHPYAPNFGALMELNFAHAITNWLGDHGWIWEFETRITSPMYLGDTLRITGEVLKKYESDGRGLVELVLRGVEQDGSTLMSARAVVELPHSANPDEVVQAAMEGRSPS